MENKIYLFTNGENFEDDLLNKLILLIPAEREIKIRKMKSRRNRENSLIAYLLLMLALKREYGIDHIPEIRFGDYGKPYLIDSCGINFNYSHCRNGVACGISNKPIGVDIQENMDINYRLIKRVCTNEEQSKIYSSNSPETEFSRIWTMKESVLKESGMGILGDMKHAVTKCSKYIRCYYFNTFTISVCSEYKYNKIINISISDLEKGFN